MHSQVARNNQDDSVATKLKTTNDSSPVIKFDISLQSDNDDDNADDGDDGGEHRYQPGDELCGDIVLVLASPLRVSSIVVQLRGEATVAWKTEAASAHSASARRHPRRHGCSRWYEASELYVDERQSIIVDAHNDLLQPGEHKFRLSFQLPRGLPTSFHGKFGDVSYVLLASFVDRKSMTSCLAGARHVVCVPFIVRRPSTSPSKSQSRAKPVSVKLSRRLFASAPFICASGLLRVDFCVVDGTSYRLGDDIHVALRVINDSPRVVVALTVSLVQICEFCAQSARRRCVALVSRRCDKNGHVTQTDSGRCVHFRLNIPPDLPESRLDGCDVIDISYELRFAVEVVIYVDCFNLINFCISTGLHVKVCHTHCDIVLFR